MMLELAVVSQIAVRELTYEADMLQARTFRAFETYLVVTLVYLGLSIGLAPAAGHRRAAASWRAACHDRIHASGTSFATSCSPPAGRCCCRWPPSSAARIVGLVDPVPPDLEAAMDAGASPRLHRACSRARRF